MSTDYTGAPTGASTPSRVHALDQLRALAMLTGVLFHAALAYSPLMQGWWLTADRQSWWGVDALIWLPHLIRMPLFFLIAGYFTALLLARDGMSGLARQRVRRILIPFLVAWPLIHLATAASTGWALTHVEHPSALLTLIREWSARPDAPPMPITTGHLWFLYYLLLFSLLLWVGRALGWGAALAGLPQRGPWSIVLGLPLVLWPGFLLTGAPHPAPEGLLPQFWALSVYGPFFLLGMGLHGHLDRLAPLQRGLWPGVLLVLALYFVFLLELSGGATLGRTPWRWAALEALIASWGTLLALLAGLRWLDRPNAVMQALAASAYWTYLGHLPVLFAVQYVLMDRDWAWPLKYAVAVGVTLALCLASHGLLVRRTRLRRYVG
ncbi:MAG: acyltransferase family protein [Xanthomonadales bacterium]|jgi:glucan biosynthesis protein C|nr:acyltransferase family protein [Xanthomonadales bacterium]